MLVLTRKIGEKVRICNDITVQVLEIRGRGIRLGIEAPSHVTILREELATDDAARVLTLDACKRR